MHFFFQGKEGRTEGPGRPPGEVGPSPDPACRACLIDPEGNEASFDCSLVKGDGASLASLPFLALGNKTLRTDCSQSPKSFKVFFFLVRPLVPGKISLTNYYMKGNALTLSFEKFSVNYSNLRRM